MGNSTYSMKKAVFINAASKYSQVVIQLLVNIILARLLDPEAYGVVAVITVFVVFFNILSDMGFGSAVIQNKTLTEEDVSNIFSFTGYLAILLAILFSLLSYVIASFYKNTIYINIGHILSISVFLNTLNMIPKAQLMKEKQFKIVAIRTVVASAGAGIVAIVLAVIGWGCYALVFQSVASSLIMLVWNYINVRIKFHFRIKAESIKKVIGFSSYQFGFNIINYFSRNLDNLVIGKVFGEQDLGIYSKSYQLMTYPINNLTSVVTPALQPILSDFQTEKNIIYNKYLEIVSVLSVLGSFVACYCFIAPEEIIGIIYGNKWVSAIPYFKVLSLSIFAQMVYVSAPAIFLSIGNSKLLFKTSIVNTSITVVGIIVGVIYKDMYALTICITIAYNCISLITFYSLVHYGFKYEFLGFLKQWIVYILIHVLLIIVSLFYPFNITNIFISAVVKGTYLFIPYVILIMITKKYKIYIKLFKR